MRKFKLKTESVDFSDQTHWIYKNKDALDSLLRGIEDVIAGNTRTISLRELTGYKGPLRLKRKRRNKARSNEDLKKHEEQFKARLSRTKELIEKTSGEFL